MIIGLSGKLRHGKDTIADYLVRAQGFQIIRISDPLKEEVLSSYSRTIRAAAVLQGFPCETEAELRRLVWEIKPCGIRELLQEHGSLRRREDPDYWVKKWAQNVDLLRAKNPEIKIVTPDVRYPNEAEAVRASSGILWRVCRPNLPTDDHPTETALDHYQDWDGYFVNDGSIRDLEEKARTWLVNHAHFLLLT